MLQFESASGLLMPGGPQTSRHNCFAVPDGLYGYWGFDTDCMDFTNNIAINLANRITDLRTSATFVTPGANSNTAGYTIIGYALPNNITISAISVYRTTSQTFNVKIVLNNGATGTVVVSESMSHGGTGWESHTLASPYVVPASGSYGLGVYSAATMNECGTATRQYYLGDMSGTQTWTGGGSGAVQGLGYSGQLDFLSKDGILNGFTAASLVDGRIGQALTFNGSTSYVDLGLAFALPQLTYSFWLPNKGTNKTAYLIARNNNLDQWGTAALVYVGGNLQISNLPTTGQTICSYASVTNGDHICVTMNNDASYTWKAYKNGIFLTSGTSTPWDANVSYRLSAGRPGSFNNYYFDGVMDDLRVYNRVLDQGEVIELHKAGLSGRRNGLSNLSIEMETLFVSPGVVLFGHNIGSHFSRRVTTIGY